MSWKCRFGPSTENLEALSAAGVPVWSQRGPGGGCQLIDGYRSPLTALSRDEARSLLILGSDSAARDLGVEPALASARQRVRDASGLPAERVMLHLDPPRWFHSGEQLPDLPALADSVRSQRSVDLTYASSDRSHRHRAVCPLGLVNKAGAWYVVVQGDRGPFVLRVARVRLLRVLDVRFEPPPEFDLVDFWDGWSADFESSRPRLEVTVRASPEAIAAMPEVFGDGVSERLADATAVDIDGWKEVRLTFEHHAAAAARLAGFGRDVEVLRPARVRAALIELANGILQRHHTTG